MSKSKTESKSIVIFGAGKIGRSFIGQLFSRGGYDVVFIDIDKQLIKKLNKKRAYKVLIKDEIEEEILVTNVRGVDGTRQEDVIREIMNTSIMAVSVGKNALIKIIPLIAKGLQMRFQQKQNAKPLDIILAENMRSAAAFIRQKFAAILPTDFPLEQSVGLVETSIGKMVPIMTKADIEKDPLQVYAEAYNSLILDRKGFLSPIPSIDGLVPKANIEAWVDRKAFIHNLGHSAAAYYGNYHHPDKLYMYEILEDIDVYSFTRSVMLQAADVLMKVYPNEFSKGELTNHINDLLFRFRNRALGDTVFRVGKDLRRKLSKNDRFVGIIKIAKKYHLPYDKILEAFTYGLLFRGKDDLWQVSPDDMEFLSEWEVNRANVLTEICGLSDRRDIEKVNSLYDSISVHSKD